MKNGYAESILQEGDGCWLCGNTAGKLDRHEVFGGAYRSKSKADGLWILLCHDSCHLNGVHKYADLARNIRIHAQTAAQFQYGWSTADFIKRYGKNYLEE